MEYPSLQEISSSRDFIDTFGGYNHNLRIGENEFFNMANMTSDFYPILSPRGKREVYKYPEGSIDHEPKGLSQKDALCYVDGTSLYINNKKIEDFELSESEEKTLVSMGAYLLIFPDKRYINTLNTSDKGFIEVNEQDAEVTNQTVKFELCTISGDAEKYASLPPSSSTAPTDPNDGDYWVDSSGEQEVLKQWSASNEMWTSIATTYIKISLFNIGKYFSQYDAVTISGIPETESQLEHLRTSPSVIYEVYHNKGDEASGEAEGTGDYIVVVGMLSHSKELSGISFARKMPLMDYIFESGNRLWGCRYGENLNGDIVNEIYASKLGDFKNWSCFMGIASDSYAASLGTDGEFTGVISHNDYPIFFKENYMHKVYGQFPANYQLQTIPCNGVQKGSNKSLATVNTVLYYKSRKSICAYDGSLPMEIGNVFGSEMYTDAVAGATDSKYYVSMKDSVDKYHMFVYDTKLGMWHREDNTHADGFCLCDGNLYYIDHDTKQIMIANSLGKAGESFDWEVQTGLLGTSLIENKYISKINVRMSLEVGSRARFMVQYDSSKEWILLCSVTGHNLRSFTIPLKPRRCDHMRLKIAGTGDAKIYSISKTTEQGSDT